MPPGHPYGLYKPWQILLLQLPMLPMLPLQQLLMLLSLLPWSDVPVRIPAEVVVVQVAKVLPSEKDQKYFLMFFMFICFHLGRNFHSGVCT
jgi:hypothetical protein